jgi:hypothetical protein
MGQAYIDGWIGAPGCQGWPRCPQDSLTLVLEDRSQDNQEAYLRVLRTVELPTQPDVFDFTYGIGPPGAIVTVLYPPLPYITVQSVQRDGPSIVAQLEPDDLVLNFHGVGPPPHVALPPSSTIESWDLLTHVGVADPGRERESWVPVTSIPYTDTPVVLDAFYFNCPPLNHDLFVALGVTFKGGAGPPVLSRYVGASVLLEPDIDGDGVNDCHDSCLDADGDGYGQGDCLAPDCDDGDEHVYPGAPQVCDGVNNDCDDPDWPDLGGTNEADDDGDSYSECEGDCDDSDPNNWISCATCSDEDEDGFYIECDDYISIDGPDNCPDDYNPVQIDDDLDDFGQPCDCDDTDPQTHPGAEEVNDGLDNQCPGDLGYGEIDETTGDSGFHDPEDNTAYSWPAQEGATRYEVARATRADFAAGCILHATSEQQVETSWNDEQVPEPGAIFFYANRPIESHVGSWGADSTGEQRHFSCISYVWDFVDTTDDDVGSSSLYEFLDASPAGPSDYIRVWVYAWGWCAARADFYRESYLQLAPVGGTANSGNWPKWHRRSPSLPWVGPDSASYPNQFGNACWNLRPYGWSSERGLLEGLQLFINPDDPTFCEAEFIDTGCFATVMAAEVRIAGTYADACDAPLPQTSND